MSPANSARCFVGNRTSRTVSLPSPGTETYTTPANSNRLSGISGAQTRSLTWLGSGVAANDNRGAGTVLPGTWVYTYDRAGRMVTAARNGTTALSAKYDGLERRVEKTAGSAVTRYIYDPDGQILAEINAANGQAIREYIWLGGLPVGLVERSSGSAVLRFVHADHLARPQKITAANRSLVWDGQYAPFGETHSVTGTITNVLLFPGQLADPETGLSQNWHRDYDPTLGRYLQPDPLGLTGGVNTFAYAGGNPIANVDPDGRIYQYIIGGLIGVALGYAFDDDDCYSLGEGLEDFALGAIGGWAADKAFWALRPLFGRFLPRSGPILKSLSAASRAEGLARKLGLNLNSPTTRQALNSLDDSVASFVSRFRKGRVLRELPSEVLDMTVEEALQHSSKVRKLLIDSRFAK